MYSVCFDADSTLQGNQKSSVSDIKTFIDLYNRDDIKHPTVRNSISYNLFARNNWKIHLTVLYLYVGIKPYRRK